MMASIGVSRVVIGRILNHADRSITGMYDLYSYDAEKRAALDLWSERLKETTGADYRNGARLSHHLNPLGFKLGFRREERDTARAARGTINERVGPAPLL